MNLAGIGVDLEDISRWELMLNDLPAHQLSAMFSPSEQFLCDAQENRAAAYAGRWCAKEAVRKATSSIGPATLREITILAAKDGAPMVMIDNSNSALQSLDIKVTIAHSGKTATAFAVAMHRL